MLVCYHGAWLAESSVFCIVRVSGACKQRHFNGISTAFHEY
jgi:hypothetical protein